MGWLLMVRRVSQDVRFSLLDLSSKRTYSSCLSMPTLRHLKWQQLDLRALGSLVWVARLCARSYIEVLLRAQRLEKLFDLQTPNGALLSYPSAVIAQDISSPPPNPNKDPKQTKNTE